MALEGIQDVIQGLMSSIAQENREAFDGVAANPAIQAALAEVGKGDVRAFYFALLYPMQNMVDGLLEHALPGKFKAQFLFKQGRFVEQHYRNLFNRYEGPACCADKSKTVVRCLLRYLVGGEEIAFDYAAQYTYHLPNRIFTTHAEIVEFFEAVYALHCGQGNLYVALLQRIDRQFAEADGTQQ